MRSDTLIYLRYYELLLGFRYVFVHRCPAIDCFDRDRVDLVEDLRLSGVDQFDQTLLAITYIWTNFSHYYTGKRKSKSLLIYEIALICFNFI